VADVFSLSTTSVSDISDIAELSLDDLTDELTTHAGHMAAGMCRYLELVAECDRRGVGAGFGSTAEWLAWRCGLNPRSARAHIRVARALEELPLVHAAFARGELSYAKVRALTRVRRPEHEDDLLELAKTLTASQLERALRTYRRATTEEAKEAHEAERLTYYWDEDGSLVVHGRLAPEDGVLFLKALDVAREKVWNERRAVEAAAVEGCGPAGPRRPSNVDALVAAADSALAHEGKGRIGADRFQVVIHVEQETLAKGGEGSCLLADGPAIAPETARRVSCDASIVTLIERNGESLGVGRKTRRISLALRRALRARDGCCRFPGCTNTHADAHHIQHWADDGTTELRNLVLLCRRHHRLVHEGGWTVDHRHRFVNAHGVPVPDAAPHPPGSLDELLAANSYYEIDPETLEGGYGGRMDLVSATRALRDALGLPDAQADAANEDARLLSRAIASWTGYENSFEPCRDGWRVVNRFGPEEAARLLPRVEHLERELFAFGPVVFRSTHPELSEEAKRALEWCYRVSTLNAIPPSS
jgi:hypothetical protein